METEFTISEQEYVDAHKLYTKPGWKVYAFYGALGITSVTLQLLSAPQFLVFLIGATCAGGIVGQELTLRLIAPIKVRRIYRNYNAAQEAMKLSLSDERIVLSADSGESNLQWNRLTKWRENDQFILLYLNDHLFHAIPKRVGDVADSLRHLLIKYVGEPK